MDAKQIAEIKARAYKATPGPWVRMSYRVDAKDTGFTIADVWAGDRDQFERDADFIARSREDVPALVADLEKVRHRHRPVLLLAADGDFNVCAECDGLRQSINPDAYPILWPCSTVGDLDGDTPTETSEEAA